jgi:mono/diheme cytochrome c family protein
VAHPKIFTPLISTRFDLKTSRVIIAVCSLTLSFALSAVFAQTPPSDATLTANPVFQKNCAKCHGKTAQGRHFGGPSLISDRTIATSADDLRNMINNGKGRMPKYASKLTPEEVDKLVEQIKAQQIKALNKE